MLLPRIARDDGVTLIELMVTVGILSGVIAGVTSALMMGVQTLGGNAARQDATAQSKVAVEAMGRSLRTAVMPSQLKGTCEGCDNAAFIRGDATSVLFYANVGNDVLSPGSGLNDSGPREVSYDLRDGVLTETVTRPKPHAVDDYIFNWCRDGSTGCQVNTRETSIRQEFHYSCITTARAYHCPFPWRPRRRGCGPSTAST